MPVNTDLGEVILRLNPYANNAVPQYGRLTGPVDIYMHEPPSFPPGVAVPAGGGGLAPPGTVNQSGGDEPAGTIVDVQVEMESNYPVEWTFKGLPQKVYKTLRIRYRYPVWAAAGPPHVSYWVEDYMLIGYEGGPG